MELREGGLGDSALKLYNQSNSGPDCKFTFWCNSDPFQTLAWMAPKGYNGILIKTLSSSLVVKIQLEEVKREESRETIRQQSVRNSRPYYHMLLRTLCIVMGGLELGFAYSTLEGRLWFVTYHNDFSDMILKGTTAHSQSDS